MNKERLVSQPAAQSDLLSDDYEDRELVRENLNKTYST
jgi:hypothetical protein